MKQAIRALGWATAIFWILVILFSGTIAYSAMQIGMGFDGEPEVATSNGTLTMSIPFSITNGGLYDISELNITTLTVAENETAISTSTTLVSLISRGDTVNGTYHIIVSLDDILAQDLTYLLFNDTDLNVNMFVGLRYAQVIPLKISSSLDDLLWGAPFFDLSINISPVSFQQANVFLRFENHAFFSLNGTISLQIIDSSDELIGSGTTDEFYVPSGAPSTSLQVAIIDDLGDMSEVHLYFDTSVFSFGPVVMAFG